MNSHPFNRESLRIVKLEEALTVLLLLLLISAGFLAAQAAAFPLAPFCCIR